MKTYLDPKLVGRLLMGAGVAFLGAALFTRQPVFAGVGGALVVIGAGSIRKASRAGSGHGAE